jgi:hypothetical protein
MVLDILFTAGLLVLFLAGAALALRNLKRRSDAGIPTAGGGSPDDGEGKGPIQAE